MRQIIHEQYQLSRQSMSHDADNQQPMMLCLVQGSINLQEGLLLVRIEVVIQGATLLEGVEPNGRQPETAISQSCASNSWTIKHKLEMAS